MSGVQSIERAFALLRSLAGEPAGVTELATRTRLPKSTVARLLQTLESEGAVERDETSTYRIGSALSDLIGGQPGPSLIAQARPYLIGLSSELGEAAGLEIYDNGWVQFVDQVTPDNDVQIRDWTGESGRAHALPTGLTFLAHLPADHLDEYLAEPLDALTANTMVDPDELRERLNHVRSVGYVWCFEEFSLGINSVAAPVFGPDGIVAALQVHGPTYRFPDPNNTHDVGRLVSDAAARLTEHLQGSRHLTR